MVVGHDEDVVAIFDAEGAVDVGGGCPQTRIPLKLRRQRSRLVGGDVLAVKVLPAQVVLFEPVAIVQDDAVVADVVVLAIPQGAEEGR